MCTHPHKQTHTHNDFKMLMLEKRVLARDSAAIPSPIPVCIRQDTWASVTACDSLGVSRALFCWRISAGELLNIGDKGYLSSPGPEHWLLSAGYS